MMSDKRYRKGFTLVEVLLGISIFSIIALTAYSVFSAGIRLNKGSQKQGQVLREIRWMLDLMQSEFENMLFYDYSSSYENKTALSGSNNRISFVKGSSTGLKVVKYYLVPAEASNIHQVIKGNTYSKNVDILLENEVDRDSYCLIREESGFVEELAGNSSESEFEIILKNIKENGVRFFYGYLKEKLSDEIVWEESWNKNYIASMIRVEVALATDKDEAKGVVLTKDIFIPTGDIQSKKVE